MERTTRRHLLKHAGVLGVGLLVTGCIGPSTSPEGAGAETPAPTLTTPAPTPTYSADVTPYRTLSDSGQRLFKKMLNEGAISRTESGVPTRLWHAKYVGYKGTEYAIKKTQTRQYVSEQSLSTSLVNETAITDEAALIAFTQLSGDAQNAFKTALTEGQYATKGSLPAQLQEHRYVVYQHSYYKLRVAVGDIPVWKLSASTSRNT